MGGLSFVLYFHSIKALPLGDAMTFLSLNPIHTMILARIFLKEQIRCIQVLATITSITGAILIAGPSFFVPMSDESDYEKDINPMGYVTAFIGSFFGACVITLIRKAGTLGVSTLRWNNGFSRFVVNCTRFWNILFIFVGSCYI